MDYVFDTVHEIPSHLTPERLSFPDKVLMCPPDFFEVIDVKNDFMVGQYGKVKRPDALREWEELKSTFEKVGLQVFVISPTPGLEDMVFTANQTFVGVDALGLKTCILGQMKHPSRRKEVPAFDYWFSANGYRVESLPDPRWLFEGAGDAIWHPGKRWIWGGVGPRTSKETHVWLSKRFSVPVARLELCHPSFYHLDTCFCPLGEDSVLYFPGAFDANGLSLIEKMFKTRIEVSESEAKSTFCCNAASFFGRKVIIQQGASRVVACLKEVGCEVTEVETGEFMKSGGSVFCMKMAFF